ncbi:MAG: molybdopterin-guanine dinucleotide biosynthesis protein B [Gemmatimonadota bacterium]
MTKTAGCEGPILGAVLAGGRSSRFGSDKGLALLGGARLLDRAVDTLRAVCDGVVVVSSRPGHEVEGAVRIPDLRQDHGPLGGIEAALRHARDVGASAVFVLACDLPTVDASVVRSVVEGLGDASAAAPRRDGPPGFEPLCAVYRASCGDVAAGLLDGGVRGAHALFERVGGRTIVMEEASALVNVNTPADLARADAPDGEPPVEEAPGRPTVVCVIGKKKSGKTTTVVGLVRELVARGNEVVTVKHGHGFELDHEGTDSWRHRHEGGAARVVMAGPDRFAVMGEWGPADGGVEPALETLVRRFGGDADIVVAEGFKSAAYPCIEVFRAAAHEQPLFGDPAVGPPGRYLAVLTDDPTFAADCPVLDVDDPDRFRSLADLIQSLAPRLPGPS